MKKYTEKEVVEFVKDTVNAVTNNLRDYYSDNDGYVSNFLKEKGLIKDKLEVGKWYKYKGWNDFLVFITNNGRYGFDVGGRWFNELDGFNNYYEEYIEATKEEVEEALIREAEKRGFKEGVKFKNVGDFGVEEIREVGNSSLNYCKEYGLYLGYSDLSMVIFKDGKWAEIVEEETKELTIEQLQKELGYKIKIV